jgi:ankyrin repeat protein
MTPLHFACFSGDSSIVEIIVNEKNIKSKDEYGNTPLHIACLHNHVKVTSVLLAKGADPWIVDNRGMCFACLFVCELSWSRLCQLMFLTFLLISFG